MEITEAEYAFEDIKQEVDNLSGNILKKFSRLNRLIGRLNFVTKHLKPCRLKHEIEKYRTELIKKNNRLRQKLEERDEK